MKTVDVIVPVYAGLLETQRCLEAVLRYPQKTNFELVVVNDQSPEPALVDYLGELAKANRIILLNNPQNLGFVGSVNLGMRLHEDRDVVLLNSDTEPVNDWLDRLLACVYREQKTGTATPFSNNATICSYPRFCQDNTIPLGMDLETLDGNFKLANAGKWVEIPTAVGFCMYIRRDCLREVGYFDMENFGKGYGEENDFCMRAKRRGWKHVLCGDVFVYHAGNVSFGDGHNTLKLAAQDTLRKLHPSYAGLVQGHIIADPAKALRQRVLMASLLRHAKPLILYISHNSGGGTERHLQELIAQLSKQTDAVVLRPVSDGSGLAEIDYQGFLKLYFKIDEELDALTDFLRTLNVERIHVHHTIGIHPAIFGLPERLGIPWDYTVHDYYPICPQISLIDPQGRYCGEPEEEGCNACLKKRPAPGNVPIKTWRDNHVHLTSGAERCFAPSKDAAERFKAYFPAANVLPVYHENILPEETASVKLPRQPVDRLQVVVIGALSPKKGADLLESVALDAKRRELPIDFVLLGYCYRNLIVAPQSNLAVAGAYREKELAGLISQHQPDVVWFPALWPETYSYTLSAAIKAGLPIVAPNIGAFQERLYQRKHTWIVPWDISESALNDFFVKLKATVFSGIALDGQEQYASQVSPVVCDFSYDENFLPGMEQKLPVSIDLESFIERWTSRGVLAQPASAQSMTRRIRHVTLFCLARLKKFGAYRWLVGRIPQTLQSRIKTWLLRSQ